MYHFAWEDQREILRYKCDVEKQATLKQRVVSTLSSSSAMHMYTYTVCIVALLAKTFLILIGMHISGNALIL